MYEVFFRVGDTEVRDHDWVAVTLEWPDGPILGHVGQVKSVNIATEDDRMTVTLSVPHKDYETVTVPVGDLVTCAVVDGPYLTEGEVKALMGR